MKKDFDNALWDARMNRIPGAEDLMRLYQTLSDDYEGNALMEKLDAYVVEYPSAYALYRTII